MPKIDLFKLSIVIILISLVLILLRFLIVFEDNVKKVSFDIVKKSNSSITDKNKTINEVKIGSQIWMTENLNTNKFRNGDTIHQVKSAREYFHSLKSREPAWSYYNFDSVNGIKYGKYYNWYAITDYRGLVPFGWHIPNRDEWSVLYKYLGGDSKAIIKMKSCEGWDDNGNGTNSSGFSALAAGYSSSVGSSGQFDVGVWWSASELDSIHGWTMQIDSYHNFKYIFSHKSVEHHSVRCVRN
jgi:uncharacterized protein (TIGR02145 family)